MNNEGKNDMKKAIFLSLGIALGITGPIKATEEEQNFKINTVKKIDQETYFKMYGEILKSYEKTLDDPKDNWFISEREQDLGKIFNTLDISIPKDQMIEIFEKYQVIVHRAPKAKKLIIGCGNLPKYDSELFVYAIDDWGTVEGAKKYRKEHTHEEEDTSDVDFVRDPTIIGSPEWNNLWDLYEEYFKHKYDHIHFEGYFPFNLDSDEKLLKNHEKYFEGLLNTDGIVTFDDGGVIYNKREGWTRLGEMAIYGMDPQGDDSFDENETGREILEEFNEE